MVEQEKLRSLSFFKIFNFVYKTYRDSYRKRNRIDFYDMIDQAIDKVPNEGLKYILIDEFQDISRARCRLLEEIKRKNNNSKLIAVGDDWQSIEAYTGTDIKIMTQDFEKIFGYKKILTLDKTFRFNQTLCDITSEFIMKNKHQLQKKVKSNIQKNNQKIVEFHDLKIDELSLDFKNNENKEIFEKYYLFLFLNKINKHLAGDTTILTRYNYYKHIKALTKPKIKSLLSKYKNIQWSTITGFKGKESDNIIIDRLQSGYFGFPAEIPEDPILFLVKNINPDEIEDAEERRFFYVALTRAKKKIFIISNSSRPSKYLEEIKKICIKHDNSENLITKNNNKDSSSYYERLNEIKLKHSKAYEKWTGEEDKKLRNFMKTKKSVQDISVILERQPSAIRSRIRKFEENDNK